MDKPQKKLSARPLSELAGRLLAKSFARQGFASTELVARWPDIVGAEIAAHCEPMKMTWPRSPDPAAPEPASLVLRVEGPVAVEIQHLTPVILERVNRFFGWRAVGRISLRQAPLRRTPKRIRPALDPAAAERIAEALPITDPDLKQALARLGAAIKRT